MKKYFLGFIILVILFFLGYHFWTIANIDDLRYIKIAGQDVRVDLALTTEEHNRGLSGRNELAENSGMLFVFDKPGRYNFWMKDMKFAIDMIWFTPSEGGADSNMKVVYIKKNAEPETYPATFGPDVNAKYVLEVNAGFSDKNNLKVGDIVVLE